MEFTQNVGDPIVLLFKPVSSGLRTLLVVHALWVHLYVNPFDELLPGREPNVAIRSSDDAETSDVWFQRVSGKNRLSMRPYIAAIQFRPR